MTMIQRISGGDKQGFSGIQAKKVVLFKRTLCKKLGQLKSILANPGTVQIKRVQINPAPRFVFGSRPNGSFFVRLLSQQ